MSILCDKNPDAARPQPGIMHFNAEHAKGAEKRGEEILCESLRFSAFSAFNNLRGLSKTIQTIESRAHRQS
jgi:hypothetical protein